LGSCIPTPLSGTPECFLCSELTHAHWARVAGAGSIHEQADLKEVLKWLISTSTGSTWRELKHNFVFDQPILSAFLRKGEHWDWVTPGQNNKNWQQEPDKMLTGDTEWEQVGESMRTCTSRWGINSAGEPCAAVLGSWIFSKDHLKLETERRKKL